MWIIYFEGYPKIFNRRDHHSFIYLYLKYLRVLYFVLDMILNAGDKMMGKIYVSISVGFIDPFHF